MQYRVIQMVVFIQIIYIIPLNYAEFNGHVRAPIC